MSRLPSGLAEVVADQELVGRFLMSSGWFAATTGRIKHPAFLPAPDNDTSVFRTNEQSSDALWALGAAALEGRPFYGAAIVSAFVIRENKLDVIAHEPPEFHANIRGWPIDSDEDLQKARRKAIAISIAEEARFVAKTV